MESSKVDDKSIGDDAVLWRRVVLAQVEFSKIPPEAKSEAFCNSSPPKDSPDQEEGMSLYLANEAVDPERLVARFPGAGVIAITAGEIRSEPDQLLVREEGTEGIDGHVAVYGRKNPGRRKRLRNLAMARGWVIEPTRTTAG